MGFSAMNLLISACSKEIEPIDRDDQNDFNILLCM